MTTFIDRTRGYSEQRYDMQYINETEGGTHGKILIQPLILEHCTTLAVGADPEWVVEVHRKAHRRSDPTTQQWPRYHCRTETGCL